MRVTAFRNMLATACLAVAGTLVVAGCEEKKKLIDIETPAGEVEVEEDQESGDVNVDVTRDPEAEDR